MNILVFGKNGQVGWELNRALLPLGEVVALGRDKADFSSPGSLREIIRAIKPQVIVNAVAYTAVDQAEENEAEALLVNGKAVEVIAEEATSLDALLVHYSTDYVFDGARQGAYTELDVPSPVNAYGRTKLAGELALQSSSCDYLIFRTSWVYAARGNNFLRTMLRLCQEREELSIVSDQTGAPVWARLIADVTSHCLRQSIVERRNGEFKSDLYHLAVRGEASWFDFAGRIVDHITRDAEKDCVVRPISTAEYPTPARRPMNSRMSPEKLESYFGLNMPEWEDALELCLDEVL